MSTGGLPGSCPLGGKGERGEGREKREGRVKEGGERWEGVGSY